MWRRRMWQGERRRERATDRRDGVTDRPSLGRVLKPGALRQLWYGWRTTLALLHGAVGGEALHDCIQIVKNRQVMQTALPEPGLTNWQCFFLQKADKVSKCSCTLFSVWISEVISYSMWVIKTNWCAPPSLSNDKPNPCVSDVSRSRSVESSRCDHAALVGCGAASYRHVSVFADPSNWQTSRRWVNMNLSCLFLVFRNMFNFSPFVTPIRPPSRQQETFVSVSWPLSVHFL